MDMHLSPRSLIRLVRGESSSDPRPNKALRPDFLSFLFRDYIHGKLMVDIATTGFSGPSKPRPPPRHDPPKNHSSARENMPTVLRLLREGQDSRSYIFLSDEILPVWRNNIVFSPLGLVPKKDHPLHETGRLIHDLSFPPNASVNSQTDKGELPVIDWPKISHVARRINYLHRALPPNATIKGMVGDVSAAYRHLSASSADASWFGLSIPEANVIGVDTSAPFGWCGSPNLYCAFGNGISWLMSRESPASIQPSLSIDHEPFWGFNYIDDHVLIEYDFDIRLTCADHALRLAMLATLGPFSLNLKKFTGWSTTLVALGLIWDLTSCTVSMPLAKIAKAQLRVNKLLVARKASRNDLEKALGSLRHVCSCIRPARAFYQNLHTSLRRLPRFGTHPLSPDALGDLSWFATILRFGHLSNVPTSIFADSSTPTFVLEMDASDEGLAILFPARRLFIRLEWNEVEIALIEKCPKSHITQVSLANQNAASTTRPAANQSHFTINVREHFCIALAVAVWGPLLADPEGRTTTHVEALTDNTSALAWSTTLASRNAFAQELNRWLGIHQAMHHLHVSARHIAGKLNTHPDAGSRARHEPYRTVWRSATKDWDESTVPPEFRTIYASVWKEWVLHQHARGRSQWLTSDVSSHSADLFDFASALWTRRDGASNSATTIQSKIAIVSWHHKCAVNYPVRLSPAHHTQLRGMHRLRPPQHAKEPVSIALLRAVRRQLQLHETHDRVIWGSTVLAFFFLLRRSEYCAVDGNVANHAIRVRDVKLLDSNGQQTANYDAINVVQVYLRTSKTDQHSRGVALQLAKSGLAWLCPVAAAWVLLIHARSIRAASSDPLCSVARYVTLKSDVIATRIKQAARSIGLDDSRYSTHSLRSGGATALFRGGASDLAIQMFGRWTSDAYKRYTRIDAQEVLGMASKMVATAL